MSLRASRFFVILNLAAAGCFMRPAADASNRAAIEAKASMKSKADNVDVSVRKANTTHNQLMALVENSRAEVPESRISSALGLHPAASSPALPSSQSLSVYACASNELGEDAPRVAEMVGRQLLLFARGAKVVVANGSLRIQSKAVIPGVSVFTIEGCLGYSVVRLVADFETCASPLSGTPRPCVSLSRESALIDIIQDIAQAVEETVGIKENADGTPTTSFVVLRKMKLVDGVSPFRCRYELDIY